MPEYRGIVKKGPEFDWGTVIEGVQKSLIDSEAARQASRDKLEKDTNDSINAMSSITLGKDESINAKLTEAAYNSKKALGDYAKLVREGKAPQKDFNMFNQNLLNTFNTFDAVGKNAKAAYETYIAENKAGNLSAASDYMAQKLGLAATLKDKKIIIDNNGRGFIQGEDPNDLVEANWLNNQKNLLIPKVKIDSIMDANADKIGKYALIGGVTKSGILSTDDAKQRKGYEDYRKAVANGVTSDLMGALSVLVDYGDVEGVKYTPTINKAEADADKTGTKIYVKLNSTGNPEPVFTPKQLELAGKVIENEIDQRINVITTQVENVYRRPVFAPDRGGDGNPAPVIPTTQDIIYSAASLDPTTKKRTPRSVFTMDVPVVDKSTGAAQNLKAIYINPVTKELEIKIEEKVVKDGITTTSDVMYSGKSHRNKEGKMVPPDIAKISNVASQIYDPVRRRHLKGYKELYEYLEPQSLTNWKQIQKGEGTQTTASGIKYTVE